MDLQGAYCCIANNYQPCVKNTKYPFKSLLGKCLVMSCKVKAETEAGWTAWLQRRWAQAKDSSTTGIRADLRGITAADVSQSPNMHGLVHILWTRPCCTTQHDLSYDGQNRVADVLLNGRGVQPGGTIHLHPCQTALSVITATQSSLCYSLPFHALREINALKAALAADLNSLKSHETHLF